MASNNNIFYATNPARMLDALWHVLSGAGVDLSDMLIFLPSRRAVRSVERMLADKSGGAVILPHLVALGEGAPDEVDDINDDASATVSNMECVVAVARLLLATGDVGSAMSSCLPVAHDLVRMANYLENEGVDISKIDWNELVDDNFATHFQRKAKILQIISEFLPAYIGNRETVTSARNRGIRRWINCLDKYKLVVVCGSTASVPATADLMAAVAGAEHGRIILSGKISGRVQDFELDTNPYNSEYKFLCRIGVSPTDIIPIDVGASSIDFFNTAFGNDASVRGASNAVCHCHLVECEREAVEANCIAQIAARSVADNKSVLVITPDAAGNQRLMTAFDTYGIKADFSGGVSAAQSLPGRAILNLLDRWVAARDNTFDKIYSQCNYDLMDTVVSIVDCDEFVFTPEFDVTDSVAAQVWGAISELSQCVKNAQLRLSLSDARALIADCLNSVSVRDVPNPNADVVVLGTIESRMQTADVVILSGLNDGMFPARGYDNNWLPRRVAREIGLPSPDRKVSLMALDFMNLSCGTDVYWVRCSSSGGASTPESRFLSRVAVAGGVYDVIEHKEIVPYDKTVGFDLLHSVRSRDDVAPRPLDYSPPIAPPDWSDVYVTKLELLIHNPYAFYAQHILKLEPRDDYWDVPLALEFGTMVHNVIEDCAKTQNLTPETLVGALDAAALKKLGTDNIIFDFWHRRFVEFAQTVVDEIALHPDIQFERAGKIDIYLDDAKTVKRTVRARADGVWNTGVMDIKTGGVPSNEQLKRGMMPQLPLEALMHISGGFGASVARCDTPEMKFLQLQRRNARVVEISRIMKDKGIEIDIIAAARDKAAEVFRIYSSGNTPYEYRPTTGSLKYKAWDDLARVDD